MAYQGIFERERGVHQQLVQVRGSELLGTKVVPPFGIAKEVYVLPMDGVMATKVSQRTIQVDVKLD
jgi:leucyl-tRNA synthetase